MFFNENMLLIPSRFWEQKLFYEHKISAIIYDWQTIILHALAVESNGTR